MAYQKSSQLSYGYGHEYERAELQAATSAETVGNMPMPVNATENHEVRHAIRQDYSDAPPAYTQQDPAYLIQRQSITQGYDELPVHTPTYPPTDPPAQPSVLQQSSHSHTSRAAHQPSSLQQPIAIPQSSATLGSPFLRCYPPILHSYNLPRESFLPFLDNLNRISVKSPPLAVLDLAGSVVGMVPLQTTQIVGGAINVASKLGQVAVSKGRTEMFLREANQSIFGPRGLKIEVAKTEALARIAGLPILNEDGKIDKKAALLGPIEDGSPNIDSQQRRLSAFRDHIAPLDVEPLPDIEVPDNFLSQLSVKASEGERKKSESKMLKEREKAKHEYHKELDKKTKEYEKEMGKLEKEETKVKRKEKDEKLTKELAKIEKERAKVQKKYEKESGKAEREKIKDDKEEKSFKKILWLVIRPLDAESGNAWNPDLE